MCSVAPRISEDVPLRYEFPKSGNHIWWDDQPPLQEPKGFSGLELQIDTGKDYEGCVLNVSQYEFDSYEDVSNAILRMNPIQRGQLFAWLDREFGMFVIHPITLMELTQHYYWSGHNDEREFTEHELDCLDYEGITLKDLEEYIPDYELPTSATQPEYLQDIPETEGVLCGLMPCVVLVWGEQRLEQAIIQTCFPQVDFNPVIEDSGDVRYVREQAEKIIKDVNVLTNTLERIKSWT